MSDINYQNQFDQYMNPLATFIHYEVSDPEHQAQEIMDRFDAVIPHVGKKDDLIRLRLLISSVKLRPIESVLNHAFVSRLDEYEDMFTEAEAAAQ